MTELTDSGVSVLSYSPSVSGSRDSRGQMRISQCDKNLETSRGGLSIGGSPGNRHGKSARSGSLERAGGGVSSSSKSSSGISIHPFVADPGMPPLPPPEPVSMKNKTKTTKNSSKILRKNFITKFLQQFFAGDATGRGQEKIGRSRNGSRCWQ